MATFAGNIRSIWATVLRVPSARHIFSNFRTICKLGIPRITDKELWVQGHTVSKRQRPDLNPVFLMTEMSGPPHTCLLDMPLIKLHSLTPSTLLSTTLTQDSPGQVLFPAGLENSGALVHE